MSNISYKTKLNRSIESLPLSSQLHFKKALIKNSIDKEVYVPKKINNKYFLSTGKNYLRNKIISFNNYYNKQKLLSSKLKKETETFSTNYRLVTNTQNQEKQYQKDVKNNRDIINEYIYNGFTEKDLFPKKNIFAPSLLLLDKKKEENDQVIITTDINEIEKDKNFLESLNSYIDYQNKKKNNKFFVREIKQDFYNKHKTNNLNNSEDKENPNTTVNENKEKENENEQTERKDHKLMSERGLQKLNLGKLYQKNLELMKDINRTRVSIDSFSKSLEESKVDTNYSLTSNTKNLYYRGKVRNATVLRKKKLSMNDYKYNRNSNWNKYHSSVNCNYRNKNLNENYYQSPYDTISNEHTTSTRINEYYNSCRTLCNENNNFSRRTKKTLSQMIKEKNEEEAKKTKELYEIYDNIVDERIMKDDSRLINYMLKYKNKKIEPVNYVEGSDLKGFLNDFVKKTSKINLPDSVRQLKLKIGDYSLKERKLDLVKSLDDQINDLEMKYVDELLIEKNKK